MPNSRPPVSPRNSGFIPLQPMSSMDEQESQQAGLSSSKSRNNDHIVVDIPLTPIRSNTSATGARKEGQAINRPDFKREPTGETENGIYHKHMGRRRGRTMQTGGDASLVDDEGTLNTMGRLYEKILNFSIVTRYLLYIIPLSLCFVTVILIGLFIAPHATIGAGENTDGVRIVWFFVWLNVVWCSLWISKLVAKALPVVFQTLVGVVSSSVKKYALVIKALEVPISLVGWAIASLCSFLPLMTQNPDQLRARDKSIHEWERRMNLVLVACLVSSIVYLGEKLIIQIVSVDYHRKQFAQRIKTNKENVKMLSRLYEASRSLFPAYTEFVEEDYMINQPLAANLINPQRSGSATPMRAILGNINVVQDKVTSAFGNIAQEVTGNKNVFNPNSAYSVVINALQKKRSSEALARRIWMSFVCEGNDAMEKEDLVEVMGPESEQAALECFASIDADGNGDVSLDEMTMYVVQLHNERKDVGRSMQDVDNAIRALDNVLGFIVFIIVVLVFVVSQQASVGTTLAGAGTVLISMSFVFAITAQEVLGSCIFLFVKHPFDVGDRVDIGDKRYVVEQISLLYSIFRSIDNQKISQVPNNVLNTLWVENISRSKHMTEIIKIGVNYDTSLEDIQKLRDELLIFVRENSRDFQQDLDAEVVGINDLDKMIIKLEIKHKGNWSNEQLTLQRRNKFFCALVLIMKKVPIYGAGRGDPSVGEEGKPMYTVAITDEKAQINMQKQAETKLRKRWDAEKEDEAEELGTSMDGATAKGKEPEVFKATSSAATTIKEEEEVHTGAYMSSPFDHSRSSFRSQPNAGRGSAESRREDVEEVRSLLKRESTKGRRKPSPSPASTQSYSQYQQQQYPRPFSPNNPYHQSDSSAAPPYNR